MIVSASFIIRNVVTLSIQKKAVLIECVRMLKKQYVKQ